MAETKVGILLEVQDRASQGLKNVSGALEGLQRRAAPAAEASQKAALGMAAFAAAAVGLASKGVVVAGQLETMRQGFVTLLGSAEKADATMSRIKEEAARTPFELAGLTSATQALALVTKDGNKSIDVLLNVGKALAAAGKGQVELDRIIANLQQIALTGKITEMDIRQFGMNGVNVLELLADQYGVTTAEAGEMVKNSKDAFGDLSAAFAKAGGEGGKFGRAFIDQAGTFQQLMSNLKDSFSIMLSDIVTKTGLFDAVKAAVARLVEILPPLAEKLMAVIEFLGNHKEVLIVIAGIIVGALVPAIYAAALAFASLALTLAPYMLAGALIGGIVAGIVWIVRNWDMLKEKAIEIWQAIKDFLWQTVDGIRIIFVETWENIKNYIVNTWQGLSESAKGWLLLLGTIMTGGLLFLVLKVIEHWDLIKAKTIEIWNAVTQFLKDNWEKIIQIIFPIIGSVAVFIIKNWDTIKATTVSVWESIKTFFSGLWDGIKKVFGEAIDWIMAKLRPLLNAIETVREGAKSIGSSIGGSVGKTFNSIGSSLNKAIGINDGIVQNGKVITTHPDDYIMAMKKPSSLVGGAGVVVNINGGNYLSESAGLMLGDQIIEVLRRNMKI